MVRQGRILDMPRVKQVFDRIAAHLLERRCDILEFAKTKYSFEEWCNWEAFLACQDGWKDVEPRPRPRYGAYLNRDDGRFADLALVGPGNVSTLVEVGVVHATHGSKWQTKLNNDTEKLLHALSRTRVRGLQIIVVASSESPLTGDKTSRVTWSQWLNKISCWNTPAFKPEGENDHLWIRGWAFPPNRRNAT